ncbi:hypothetical protein SAMN05421852_10512 [Thermoflavimicrobium dichotomicum]|uniref:Uncharacterized protein n=2 Tax=Thermoflavimicrobium dichotomicum TaxID=46223 RepID=A0A1I3NXG1_9BACL|nr:hypothetical protein SAMN05421852_10512 [Thermoflavimicrobium dichotomicum]
MLGKIIEIVLGIFGFFSLSSTMFDKGCLMKTSKADRLKELMKLSHLVHEWFMAIKNDFLYSMKRPKRNADYFFRCYRQLVVMSLLLNPEELIFLEKNLVQMKELAHSFYQFDQEIKGMMLEKIKERSKEELLRELNVQSKSSLNDKWCTQKREQHRKLEERRLQYLAEQMGSEPNRWFQFLISQKDLIMDEWTQKKVIPFIQCYESIMQQIQHLMDQER